MMQESVWDYPRPPRLAPSARQIRVVFAKIVIAQSTRCLRLLETSHPPTWYIPEEDVRMDLLSKTDKQSFCEFKGLATYWTISAGGQVSRNACWSYEKPAHAFSGIRDYFSFYASRVDECSVDGEIVRPQDGDFYGGWITSDVTGPFKGGVGTRGW